MDSRLFRLVAGIAAGGVTALLVDQLLFPATLVPGLIGAFTAATVLSFASSDA